MALCPTLYIKWQCMKFCFATLFHQECVYSQSKSKERQSERQWNLIYCMCVLLSLLCVTCCGWDGNMVMATCPSQNPLNTVSLSFPVSQLCGHPTQWENITLQIYNKPINRHTSRSRRTWEYLLQFYRLNTATQNLVWRLEGCKWSWENHLWLKNLLARFFGLNSQQKCSMTSFTSIWELKQNSRILKWCINVNMPQIYF